MPKGGQLTRIKEEITKMDFRSFKKQQSQLKDAVEKMAIKPANNYADERMWNLTKDAAGNAAATIRFLPQQDPALSPIQLTFRHSFQKAGRWFIEECPHTIAEKCPVCEYATSIWNDNEKEARLHWRAKSYICNILVVEDPSNPENDGKVFLYKFGKKIYDKIMDRVAPEDEDESGVNVFDYDEGLNFKLKLTQVSDFNNYDKSKFVMTPSAIADGDVKVQESIFKGTHSLAEFTDKTRFKSFNELVTKLNSMQSGSAIASIQEEINSPVENKEERKKETKVSKEVPEEEEVDTETEEEEIDFDSLLADDD
jgi:hypothetical protein